MRYCMPVTVDCYNLEDSYGMICVRCNCCGRFDTKTMWACRLELTERLLQNTKVRCAMLEEAGEIDAEQADNFCLIYKLYEQRIAECRGKINADEPVQSDGAQGQKSEEEQDENS